MIVTTPAYPNHIDTTSTLIHAPSSKTIIPNGAVPPVGTAANCRSLWRSILDTHGKDILQCASDQFLDLATALRLESINAKDLASLLAKAGRLGYRGTNIVEDNAVDCLAHEADEGTQPSLDNHSASKVPDVERDQGSDSTTSEPSPAEASSGLKRRKKNEDSSLSLKRLRRTRVHPTRPSLEKPQGNNVRQRSMRMQDQTHRSDVASGKSNAEPPVLQADAPHPRSSTAVKRPRFQHGVRPVAKQSQGTLAQRIDFVIISDTERESSAEDKF